MAKAEVFEAAVLEEQGSEAGISNVDVPTEVSEAGISNVDVPTEVSDARTKGYVEGIVRCTPTKNIEHALVRIPEGVCPAGTAKTVVYLFIDGGFR